MEKQGAGTIVNVASMAATAAGRGGDVYKRQPLHYRELSCMLPEKYVGSQDTAALIHFFSKVPAAGYKVHTLHQTLEDEK